MGGWRRVVAYAAALTLAVLAVNVIRCILLTVVKTDHPVRFVFEHE